MTSRSAKIVVLALAVVLTSGVLWAQRQRGRGGRGGRGYQPAAEQAVLPSWENTAKFPRDVFTFARVEFDSYGRGDWANDFPDCDLNFSYRLQQLTAFKVNPNNRHLRLTDPDLYDYPFLFLSNGQGMMLGDDEAKGLRQYLFNGGFLMVDDTWTRSQWEHIRGVFEQVLPGTTPVELQLDHPIFHIVYDLKALPQVPSIFAWRQGDKFEHWHGDSEGDEGPHFWGYHDDKGRLMVLCCHNNDIGDGWEREGEESEYFRLYSEKWSYPFGINVVTYAMTH